MGLGVHLADGRFFLAVGSDKVRVFLTLPAGLASQVEAVAEAAGVTKSAVIEAVLDRHLGSYPADAQKVRLAFSGESREARTARLQREGREAQARRDASIGAGR